MTDQGHPFERVQSKRARKILKIDRTHSSTLSRKALVTIVVGWSLTGGSIAYAQQTKSDPVPSTETQVATETQGSSHNTATQTSDDNVTEWYYTKGSQVIKSTVGTSYRHIEVWTASDGRYRVMSTSLDGSGAYEEIAYDGEGNQLIKIVAGTEADPSFYSVKNDKHFAVTPATTGTHERYSGTAYDKLILKSSGMTAGIHSARFTSGSVTQQKGDPSMLSVVVPEGTKVGTQQELEGKTELEGHIDALSQGSTAHTASRTQVITDLYSQPCMETRNHRNTSTNYFGASSRRTSDLSREFACMWVHVAAWAYGYLNGWCIYDWAGQGAVATYYSSWAGTINNSDWQEARGNRVAACSSHSAWDRYWVPHVTGYHLSAAIAG